MQSITKYVSELGAWVFPVVVVVGALIVNRVVHGVITLFLRRAEATAHVWRNAVIRALNAPLRALVWLLALFIIKNRFLPRGTDALLDRTFVPLLSTLAVLIITWFLLRIVKHVKQNYLASAGHLQHEVDQTAVDAMSKLAWAFILIFAVISILQSLHVPLASLLAFGGAAGIAVGFAAQTLVANLFGGLTVYASRIFKIGDYIILPGSDLSGEVQYIGWRSTRVMGWDGYPFYIPNSEFNSSNVVNQTRMTHRRISEYVPLRYEDIDRVEDIVREGNELLENREDIGYFVFRFDSYGDGALKLFIYAYAQTADATFLPYGDFMRIKQEVLLAVASIARKHGCELLLPISHVYLRGGAESEKPSEPTAGIEDNSER